MSNFDPKIVIFCCDQSGYPAADMASQMKLEFPPGVEIVRVPCAGSIETIYLLKALEKGADGVLLFACHEENCGFLQGSLRARAHLDYGRRLLQIIGLEKERLDLCHLATNSGVRFAETLQQKAEELRKLGPNPLRI